MIALPASNGIIRIAYPTPEAPGYFVAMSNWDGQWYHVIAEHGYPAILPRDYTGAVDMSPWAFFPVFPMSVGLVMKLTGWSFYPVATTMATLAGAAACVMLYRLVESQVGRWAAICAVVGLTTFVSAPVLQAAYTESYGIVAVLACLMLLRARRYGWLLVALVVLALTRNIVLVMAPVIAVHLIVRWCAREKDPFTRRERWLGLIDLVAAGALTGLWPLICGIGAHDLKAYGETMAAWKINAGDLQLGNWIGYLWSAYGVVGTIGVAVFLVWFVRWMCTRQSWYLGPELWAWTGAYPAYQVLVTGTHPSRLRYALLGFGFTLVLAYVLERRHLRRWRVLLLVAIALGGMVYGAWWVSEFMITSHLDGNVMYP